MKKFLASTATIIALATSAAADGHTAAFSDMSFDAALEIYGSELIGARVYASEADIEGTMNEADAEWDDIGEINNLVLTRDGQVQSVIVGVGGFLGIGEKDVRIDMSQLQFVSDGDDANDYFLVVKASAVGVQDAPTFEREIEETETADMSESMETDTDTETMAADTMADVDGRVMLDRPMVEREGYQTLSMEDFNTEDLTGARVYGSNDEDIGEISELLLTAEGQIDRAVIDVGGFLGMGEKPVAVTMDELQIVRNEDGSDLRVYIDATQEALEAQPDYEG